jgi:co-chaperonin GroES (HSP10)
VNTLKYACRANKIEKVVHGNIREYGGVEEYRRELISLRKENEVLKMNLNMSLMVPGLSSELVEQENKRKRNKVGLLLDKLTKESVDRMTVVAVGEEGGRFDHIKEMVKSEEEIKEMILSEFGSHKDRGAHTVGPERKLEFLFEKSETPSAITKKMQPPFPPPSSKPPQAQPSTAE